MFRLSKFLLFVLPLVLLAGKPVSAAWFWGEKQLCSIGGESYSDQDFKEWWKYFKDEGKSLPEDLGPFIDWQLLVKEAERMGLDQDPSFQREIENFLKVRSFLLLKNEEIDAKINLTPALIRAYYEQEYCPQYRMELLFFNNRQLAEQAATDLRSGRQTIEYYKGQSNNHGTEVDYQERILQPRNIDSEWVGTLAAMQVGEVSPPQLWKEEYVVFHLLSKIWFDEADFEKQKDAVTQELSKIQETKLTAALVNELKAQYHVQVNEELFSALDPYAVEGISAEAILISTSKNDITVGQFLEQVRKQKKFFKQYGAEKDEHDLLKQQVLNKILSHKLISWAALDRHYELTPLLHEVYQFYTQHRLIKELEKRLFGPESNVSPAEVETYYRQHEEEFTQPAMVHLARMEYSGEQIDRIWAEIITGSDLGKVAEKYTGRPLIETEQLTEQLDPGLEEVVVRLSPGEIAPPFLYNGHWQLVKLINKRQRRVETLAVAADRITAILEKEKVDRARATFLDLLKTKVSITVNNSVWQALQAEMAE